MFIFTDFFLRNMENKKNYSNALKGHRVSHFLRWYLWKDHVIPIDVFYCFRDLMIEALVTNPEGVTLPGKLGRMKILANKASVRDHVTTKKVWGNKASGRVLIMDNSHTDGYVFKVQWYDTCVGANEDVLWPGFKGSNVYAFEPSKSLRQALKAHIQAGNWRDYHLKSRYQAPADVEMDYKRKMELRRLRKSELEDDKSIYDESDED